MNDAVRSEQPPVAREVALERVAEPARARRAPISGSPEMPPGTTTPRPKRLPQGRARSAHHILLEDPEAGDADRERGVLGELGGDVEVVGDPLELGMDDPPQAAPAGGGSTPERALDRLGERRRVGDGCDPGHTLGEAGAVLGASARGSGARARAA